MAAKTSSSGIVVRIVVILAVAAAIGAAVTYSLRPVARVAAAYKGKAINAVPGSVTVEAEFPQNLTSEVEGRLLTSELDPGKAVKAGEVVAQLNPSDLKLDIDQLKSDLEVAKKRLEIGKIQTEIDRENAKDALDQAEFNFKSGLMPAIEIAKARRTHKALENRLTLDEVNNQQLIANLENTIKVKQNTLAKMTITAAFDGVVSVVLLRPGDLVPAKTPIGTLISTTRTVVAKISEENFAGVKVGQKATVRFLSYGGDNYDATVSKMLPTADPGTQRYVIYLDVKIAPEKLVPDITGEVSVIVAERDNAILIPRRALFGSRVYVVADGKVQMRSVEIGYVDLNVAEITKGLSVGDQVIVQEREKFRDGDRVRVELEKRQ